MALVPLRLPRLQQGLAIVDPKTGRPSAAFVRYWNVELLTAIERQINDLTEIQAELADQLALILEAQAAADAAQVAADAAQVVADEALLVAEAAGGAKYVDINGAAATSSADEDVTGVTPTPLLVMTGTLENATIDADTSWEGTVTLREDDGVTFNVIGTGTVSLVSDGLALPGPSWGTVPGSFRIEGIGTLDGPVTYQVSYAKDSGADFVVGAQIFSNLIITPRAS